MSVKGFVVVGVGIVFAAAITVAVLAAIFGDLSAADTKDEKVITTASGLRYVEQNLGDGTKESKEGSVVKVHYKGMFENGKEFDSSIGKKPLEVTIGAGGVIQGWEEGLQGMKVGGKRKLYVPSELAYGKRGKGTIPPNTNLVFEIEMLEIK